MADSKKRKKKRASRLPTVLLIAAMAGVAGWLVVLAQETPDESPTSPTVTIDPSASTPGDTASPGAGLPSTIGSVAPPITVESADNDVDGDDGLILDDFTPTDTPQRPATPRTVPSEATSNGEVAGPLPDGDYIGYLEGVGDSASILVRFDSASGPVFEAPTDDLLFVSLRVDARDPSHPGSAVVSARTLSQLLEQGDPTYNIPDTDDVLLIDGTFLITVVDGLVVGLEALG